MNLLAATGAFSPVDQHYLLQARQMQALSFAAHIPLVAFGISFPAMVLFVEWLADVQWAHAVGVTCLIGFVVVAFLAIVVPALDAA